LRNLIEIRKIEGFGLYIIIYTLIGKRKTTTYGQDEDSGDGVDRKGLNFV